MKTTRLITFLLILLFILILISSLIIINRTITARAIESKISQKNIEIKMKQICNTTDSCQDYQITCWDNQVIEIKPVSGTQFLEDLDNPELKEIVRRLCE